MLNCTHLFFICDLQPEGGVIEGQVFLVPLPADFAVGEPQLNIPTGHWKDGLFDFLKAGPFHPSLWCACCCTQSEFLFDV
jgi:hypothetical protein